MSYTAHFGDGDLKPLFSLTIQKGSLDPIAGYVDARGMSGDDWSKCDPNGVVGDYQRALGLLPGLAYPYLLPPCCDTQQAQPWHVDPSWTCPKDSTYVDQIGYGLSDGVTFSIRNGCLAVSSKAPECPAGFGLVKDAARLAGHDHSVVSPIIPDWQDVCAKLPEAGAQPDPKHLGCDPGVTDVSKGGCPRPTCAAPKSVFGIKGASPIWVLPRTACGRSKTPTLA